MQTLACGLQDAAQKTVTGGVRAATKGKGARETLAATRNCAIRHAPAKSKPRLRVPDRGLIKTMCVRPKTRPDAERRTEMSACRTLRRRQR